MELITSHRTRSKFKGVYFDEKRRKQWRSMISFKGKLFTIGYFKTEVQAAEAYSEFSQKHQVKN